MTYLSIPPQVEAWASTRYPEYEVSTHGRVRRWHHSAKISPKERILKGRGRYPSITVYSGGKKLEKKVHLLVAEVFGGPKPPGTDVHHINRDTGDAAAGNLVYADLKLNRGHKL